MGIEKYVGVLSGMVIGAAQVIYLLNCLRKKITPSVLSWLGWAFLMGTSVVSQVVSKGWQWSMTAILCSTVGCLAIAGAAFFSGNYSFKRSDLGFLLAGLGCVAIYVLSDNPWMTTVFAVVADALLGIPTIRQAVKDPASERSAAWILGVVSSTLALGICLHHNVIYMLFPVYLWIFNGVMSGLTWGRGKTKVSIVLPVLLAGFGILGGGCHKHSAAGAAASRSYRMGFANSAPRPDINLIIESLGLWTQHSDATIISTEVPWDSLIGGEDPATYVTDTYVQLVSICRSKNMKIWLYFDPENGLNRSSDSDPLVALGLSIAQPAMQQLYRRFVVVADSMLQPDHLGVALETNLIRFIAPDSIYQGVKTAANGAAADVRAIDKEVMLSVSVQAEVAWGRLGNTAYVGVGQDFTDFPFLQELGISSYPYLGGFGAPSAIPLNYYSQLGAGHSVPVFVSEGGWTSMNIINGATGQPIVSSPAAQQAYIDRQGQLLAEAHGIGIFQLTFTDLDLSGWGATDSAELYPFAFLGVVDSSFNPKPALAAWDSLLKQPLETGH